MNLAIRPIIHLAFVLAVVLLGVRLAMTTFSEFVAVREPAIALWLDGSNPRARLEVADQALRQDPPDIVAAREAAMRSLGSDPLSARTYRLLARIAAAEGDDGAAGRLMIIAQRFARDSEAQIAGFNAAFRERRFVEALDHLDILYRSGSQSRWASINAAIAPLLIDELFLAALSERLVAAPAWRNQFVLDAMAQSKDIEPLITLFDKLKTGAMNDNEVHAFINRLVREGRFTEAFAAFNSRIPAEAKHEGSLLFNGDFSRGLTNLPFDWVISPSQTALVGVRREDGRNVLRVDFFGSRAPFRNVNQLLMLEPGAYRFSGIEQAVALRNERGVRWRIHCINAPNEALAVTENLRGGIDWREFSLQFLIPESCPVQNLVLELPARFSIEQEATGGVAYADLAITRVTP